MSVRCRKGRKYKAIKDVELTEELIDYLGRSEQEALMTPRWLSGWLTFPTASV